MAYTINKTDGSILATVTDGTIDTTSSNITLIGKSYSGWGESLNENLVRILENSASTSAPTTPLRGQLWFDVNTGGLKVYNGSEFEPAGGAQPSASIPTFIDSTPPCLLMVNETFCSLYFFKDLFSSSKKSISMSFTAIISSPLNKPAFSALEPLKTSFTIAGILG